MRDKDIITAKEIAQLIYKEMHDELTKEERLRLNQWRWSLDVKDLHYLEEKTEAPQLAKDLLVFGSFDSHAALKDVQQRIAAAEAKHTRPSARYLRIRMIIGCAVFAILCIGLGLLYILNARTHRIIEPSDGQAVVSNAIVPGGDKAMLTLSDGRQIALDHAGNGQLAQQGTSQVMKLAGGQIAYQAIGGSNPISNSSSTSYNVISTPGGQYQIMLPDGSRVWLNAASSLRFPTAFTGKERRVILTGEAFFQVHPDLSMPFKVSIAPPLSSGGGGAGATQQQPIEVNVLGTEFNIKAYADERDVSTTLINGAVKVQSGNAASILKPGQQALVEHGNSSKIHIVSDPSLDEVVAWKEGYFLFQSASLESVMNQLARWYDVQVVYEGAKPTQLLTAHVSRKNNLTDILRVLEISGYYFEIHGRTVVVKH